MNTHKHTSKAKFQPEHAESARKPWMAGVGIKCPSSLSLEKIGNAAERESLSAWINALNDVDRCGLEVSIAIDLLKVSPPGLADHVNAWLDECQPRLIECMELGV